ncbi:MAG: restriction endonuclease subunit S [Methylobacterium sp.]|nr:restriction endonuclease subunit S [Methylobacterium sp.]MCA3608374.1 restriction endonuclease subunit S [Methylobacterium sp.]MCA3617889.1 restriction endonuclease subunit S [Methylobacterium sp.]MCA3621170.1 restriction endonuclease subunit S [Methylobacterium sp.]
MPGDLPRGWQAARFKDVMRLEERREPIDPKRIYKLLGVRWYGNGAFLREEREGEGLSAQHIYPVRSGDVIYNRLFAWKGSFGLVGDDLAGCYVSNEFPLFAARLDRVDPQFLLGVLQHPRTAERADAFSTGTTSISRNRLGEDDFLQFPLNLPPLAEQRAIANVLGAVEVAIRKTEALIEALSESQNALLRGYFDRKKNWLDWTNVGKLGRWQSGGTPATAKAENWTGSVPWVCPKDIKGPTVGGTIDHISEEAAQALGIVHPGTLLLVVRGMILTRAVPSAICTERCAFNQDVKAFVPNDGVHPAYLKLWLDINEQKLLGEIETATHGTKRFPLENLKAFPVPMLADQEQREVIALFDTGNARLLAERRHLQQLSSTRDALGQELLSGRLRLPASMIARHADAPDKAA